ncbi:MAG: NlpC/P60 family protein [Deltaproteobacteria bacterium]
MVKCKAKSVTGDQVVATAKAWLGTPYHHQASTKGAGTDCLGLIRGLWRELYGSEPEVAPTYTREWAEPQGEEVLMDAAMRHLVPVAKAEPGDVLIFRMSERGIAKHLGVLSRDGDQAAFIHAYERHGVVESALSAPWARRVAAVFRFPKKG